jgi:hypothetical protein
MLAIWGKSRQARRPRARSLLAWSVVVNEAAENKARANRERRLSAALRENLKRRKVQARARSLDTPTSDAAAAHDSAGIREKDKEEA